MPIDTLWIWLLCLAAAFGIWLFLYDQTNRLQVTRYALPSDRVTQPVRLVHISDLHCKAFGEDNARLYRTIAAQNPDLICCTGDMVNRTRKGDEEQMLRLFARLARLAPTVCIFGNHDVQSELTDWLRERLEAVGVTVLENETARFSLQGQTVQVLGLQEFDTDPALPNACMAALAQSDGFRLALSHYPEYFAVHPRMRYHRYGVDLVLSGHGHGGQFILPLIGPVFSPGQGLFPKYARGLHRKNGAALIVSRGLGGTSFPFRLFNHPEVGVIEIGKS